MPQSPSVIAAATTLAEWARERRRAWSDEPLPVPVIVKALAAAVVELPVEIPVLEVAAPEIEEVVAPEIEDVARPSVSVRVAEACEWLQSLGEPAAHWLARGAAVVSTMSVVLVVVANSDRLFVHWNRFVAMAIAEAHRPAPAPPAPAGLPAGTGRLVVLSSTGAAQVFVDGTPRGVAPVTVELPAGPHRVLLHSTKGSVERTVRIQAGESSEMNESIFPGWLALTTSVDLTLSEGGRLLKRDERGWAILPPGPHDIHLDNGALGVHDVRRVVVTPGDTTRLSFAPQASVLSLTTNELAEVWIDGAAYGQAPLVDQPIALGLHDVRVRSALHERWLRVRATVQPLQVNVDLTVDRQPLPR